MKERRLHIYIVSLILAGPVVTLIAGLIDSLDFLFYVLPVTIDSIDLRVDSEQIQEFRIAGMIIPFFNIKIIVFGLIVLTKLIQDTDDNNYLRRFYIMTLLVTSIRLILMFFYYESDGQNYYFGLFGHLLWIIGLVWVIKKRTHNNVHKSWWGDIKVSKVFS